MSNRLDRLFKESVPKHHLPNDGPGWDGLEARMNGKKRRPLVFFAWSIAILTVGSIALYYFLTPSPGGNTTITQKQDVTNQTEGRKQENQSQQQNETEKNQTTKPEVSPSSDKISNNNTIVIDRKSSNSNVQKPVTEKTPAGKPADENPTVVTNENPVSEIKTKPEVLIVQPNAQQIEDSIRSIKLKKAKDSLISSTATEVRDSLNDPKPGVTVVPVAPPIRKQFPNKRRLLGLYLSFTPRLITSKNIITEDNKTNRKYAALRSGGEKMKDALGLDLGIRFSPPALKRISFTTGVNYEKREETVSYHFLRDDFPFTDSATGEIFFYIPLDTAQWEKIDYSNTNTYSYIGVPFTVNFDVPVLKWFELGLQFNGNYIHQTGLSGKTINKTFLNLEDLNSGNSTQLKNIFNAGLGLNLRFLLTKNLIINITPDYKKQFTRNSKTSSTKQSTLNIGLQYFIL